MAAPEKRASPLTQTPPPAPFDLARLGPPDNDVAPLAAVLAHRLRSIVGSIQGYAELLADTVGDSDRDLALHILEGTAAVERVIADLLCFGHRADPVLLSVPIAASVAGLLDALGASGERVQLALEVSPDYRCVTDPVLFRQILIILLQNALDATSPLKAVDLYVSVSDGALAVEVSNDAEVEDVEQMFKPFFTTKTDRLGLGLAIARRAAEDLGGALGASSESGRVTVTLTLPPHVQPQ